MKKYLIKIDSGCGAVMTVDVFSDRFSKPIIIHYCGRDIGYSYVNIGNASRQLEKTAQAWADRGCNVKKTYGTASDIHYYGCDDFNTAILKAHYTKTDKAPIVSAMLKHGYFTMDMIKENAQ